MLRVQSFTMLAPEGGGHPQQLGQSGVALADEAQSHARIHSRVGFVVPSLSAFVQ